MEGWLKLHRSLADHWIFSFKEPDKALAWIDLLIMASYADHTIMLKGRALELKRGQVGMSQLSMQKRWGWSQNKVKRFLKLLKKHEMADYQTNDLTTVVTVCNFDSFQTDGRADERPNERADERTANDQTNDDIRKKEGKKEKNSAVNGFDYSSWPNVPSDQVLKDYKAMRVQAKSRLSQTIIGRLSKPLCELNGLGYSVDEVLAICCEKSWKGLKTDWVTNLEEKKPSQQEFYR